MLSRWSVDVPLENSRSLFLSARHSARRNKGYFNCGALKPPAITVKITRYLPRVEAEIPHCGGLHYFQALRGYGMKAWRTRALPLRVEHNAGDS